MIGRKSLIIALCCATGIGALTAQLVFRSAKTPLTGELPSQTALSTLLDHSFTDYNEKPFKLSQWSEKILVINFWATWCPPCREEMPSLHRLAKRWLERGLVVITVAVADDKQRVTNYLEGIGMPFAVIHDQDQTINQQWDAYAVPTTLILDAHHRIRLRGLGAIDWDDPAIDQQLKAALN